MVTINLPLPEPVLAEYYSAAEQLNAQLGPMKPALTAHTLMAFALSRIDTRELCSQFDLTLRAITGTDVPVLPNPVLK